MPNEPHLFSPVLSRDLPYNDLPLLPPTEKVETERTLKVAIGARTALADLKGAGRLIPDQSILMRAIVLQEARLSSEVENIVTTNDELYQALNQEHENWGNPHTKEVMMYGEAVWRGQSHLKRNGILSTGLFCELCSTLKGREMNIRALPGTKITHEQTGETIYYPPEGPELIHKLLLNMSEYLYDDQVKVDPVIRMAVAHYQFEAIHPFSDGNGRTGRVLNILYLVNQRLLDLPILYLSKTILKNKGRYYEGLRQVTEEGAWEEWILYMLEAVETTAIETREKIEAIKEGMDDLVRILNENEATRKFYSRELVEIIYSQPYLRTSNLEEAGLGSRLTVTKYLKTLEAMGLLVSIPVGRRVLYLNQKLMSILVT